MDLHAGFLHTPHARRARMLATGLILVGALVATSVARGQNLLIDSFEPAPLQAAPQVVVLRDDRVATLELDYDPVNPWGQFWTMTGAPEDDAGFLVTWWPQTPSAQEVARIVSGNDGGGSCLNPDHLTAPVSALAKGAPPPPGSRWLVTGNRRVQIQPLQNDAIYHLRVERINALGQITSYPTLIDFNGGDGARVAALRTQMTYFDDFNLPLGAADERLWNNVDRCPLQSVLHQRPVSRTHLARHTRGHHRRQVADVTTLPQEAAHRARRAATHRV